MSTKIKTEIASARNFVRWYSHTTDRKLIALKKQEAPDFVCRFGDCEIGLEITTAYYDDRHAKAVWRIARGEVTARRIQDISSNGDESVFLEVYVPEQKILDFINNCIRIKCEKSYGIPTILLIRIPCLPLTADRELQHEVIPNLKVPNQNPFREVYLTADQKSYFLLARGATPFPGQCASGMTRQ
jgi:hypothetical protein